MSNAKVKHKVTGEVCVLHVNDYDHTLYDLLLCPCNEPVTYPVPDVEPEPELDPVEPVVTDPDLLARWEELKAKGWKNLDSDERTEYQQLKSLNL